MILHTLKIFLIIISFNLFSQEYNSIDLNKNHYYEVACLGGSFKVSPQQLSSATINGDRKTGSWRDSSGTEYRISKATHCHSNSQQKYNELKELDTKYNEKLTALLERRRTAINNIKTQIAEINEKRKELAAKISEEAGKYNQKWSQYAQSLNQDYKNIVMESREEIQKMFDIDVKGIFLNMSQEEIDRYITNLEKNANAVVDGRTREINALFANANKAKNLAKGTAKSNMYSILNQLKLEEIKALKLKATITKIELAHEKKVKDLLDQVNAEKVVFEQIRKEASPIINSEFSQLQKQMKEKYKMSCTFQLEYEEKVQESNSCNSGYSLEKRKCKCVYDTVKGHFDCSRQVYSSNIEGLLDSTIKGEYRVVKRKKQIYNEETTIYSAQGVDIEQMYADEGIPPILDYWFQKQVEAGKMKESNLPAVISAMENNPDVNWDCDQCDIHLLRHENKYGAKEFREQVLQYLHENNVPFANFDEWGERSLMDLELFDSDNKYVSENNLRDVLDNLIYKSRARGDDYVRLRYNKRRTDNEFFLDAVDYLYRVAFYSIEGNEYSTPPEDLQELKDYLRDARMGGKSDIVVAGGAQENTRKIKDHDPFFYLEDRKGRQKIRVNTDRAPFFKHYSYDEIIVKCKDNEEILDDLEEELDEENEKEEKKEVFSQEFKEKQIDSLIEIIDNQVKENKEKIAEIEKKQKAIESVNLEEKYEQKKKEIESQFEDDDYQKKKLNEKQTIDEETGKLRDLIAEEKRKEEERKRKEEERKRKEEEKRKKEAEKKRKEEETRKREEEKQANKEKNKKEPKTKEPNTKEPKTKTPKVKPEPEPKTKTPRVEPDSVPKVKGERVKAERVKGERIKGEKIPKTKVPKERVPKVLTPREKDKKGRVHEGKERTGGKGKEKKKKEKKKKEKKQKKKKDKVKKVKDKKEKEKKVKDKKEKEKKVKEKKEKEPKEKKVKVKKEKNKKEKKNKDEKNKEKKDKEKKDKEKNNDENDKKDADKKDKNKELKQKEAEKNKKKPDPVKEKTTPEKKPDPKKKPKKADVKVEMDIEDVVVEKEKKRKEHKEMNLDWERFDEFNQDKKGNDKKIKEKTKNIKDDSKKDLIVELEGEDEDSLEQKDKDDENVKTKSKRVEFNKKPNPKDFDDKNIAIKTEKPEKKKKSKPKCDRVKYPKKKKKKKYKGQCPIDFKKKLGG